MVSLNYRISKAPQGPIGPKTIIQELPPLRKPSGAGEPVKVSTLVTLNTAPQAGQLWQVGGVYFEFPKANKIGAETGVNLTGDFQFNIRLLIGGVVVAKQTFLTPAKRPKGTEALTERFNVVGNLEAFSPMTVYAGQAVAIEYELVSPNERFNESFIETNQGKVIFNYTQENR